MAKYIIQGGNTLSGQVTISGNKNSVLPCLAACLLTEDEVVITNVPNIADVYTFVEIFKHLGVEITVENNTARVRAKSITTQNLPHELMRKLRASVLLAGPMLARMGHVEFSHPGGDVIGKRSIDAHIEGFEKLGAKFETLDREYRGVMENNDSYNLDLFLPEASVTGLENILLAAVTLKKKIKIKNCPVEPHVVDLCNLLAQMGAQIEGIGTGTLTVTGVEKLHGAEFRVGQDFVEMGTYAVAAGITRGVVLLKNCSLDDMEPIILPLQKMGIVFEKKDQGIEVSAKEIQSIPKLHTNIWPGFPTDMMSVVVVLASQAKGVSLLHDWMYESRMFFVDKLISMGANITIADPHRVVVYGPAPLLGRNLETPDIRAGMALVLAALVAQGETVINRAELIERGYDNIVENLRNLGANIQREE